MRRWSLALLVSLASPAFAQAPSPTAPAEAPPQAPAEAPPAAAKAPQTPEAPPAAAQPPAAQPPAAAPQAPARKPAAAPAPAPQPAQPSPTTILKDRLSQVPPAPAEETVTLEELNRRDIRHEARFLFQSLLTGDVRNAAAELTYPFQLEDKRYATPEELVQAWVKQVRLKRTDLVTLYDIEVLPLAEMEKKYGKAPARLGLDLRNVKDVWAAVGNLSGHAAIFLFRPVGEQWRAFAYTD